MRSRHPTPAISKLYSRLERRVDRARHKSRLPPVQVARAEHEGQRCPGGEGSA